MNIWNKKYVKNTKIKIWYKLFIMILDEKLIFVNYNGQIIIKILFLILNFEFEKSNK